jgi:hypothetical protein
LSEDDDDPETPLDALAELLDMMEGCRRELLECERNRLDRIAALYYQWLRLEFEEDQQDA